MVKCDYCGKLHAVGGYRIANQERHFCSKTCRIEWYANIWSQQDSWREESRKRAASLLKENGKVTLTKPQRIINSMLDGMGVKYENEKTFVYYAVDNYLIDENLVVEVMGDFWHGNPNKYAPNKLRDIQIRNIPRDKAKHTYISKHHNIEILYLWEADIYKSPDLCKALIRQYIGTGGDLINYHSFNYHVEDGKLKLNNNLIIPYQDIDTKSVANA